MVEITLKNGAIVQALDVNGITLDGTEASAFIEGQKTASLADLLESIREIAVKRNDVGQWEEA